MKIIFYSVLSYGYLFIVHKIKIIREKKHFIRISRFFILFNLLN